MRQFLPKIQINVADEPTAVSPRSFFSENFREIWLEIGFGAGEHLACQASRNPDVGFIGCEPFLNGVSALTKKIALDKLSNVRIFPDDARILLSRLKEGEINRLFVLFPDPWPKERHKKRRMISKENVDCFSKIIADGGEFRFSTDHIEYAEWTISKMVTQIEFDCVYNGTRRSYVRPYDWPTTRYEQKAVLANRDPIFLQYIRINRSDMINKSLQGC